MAAAFKARNVGKSAGVDNIPAELLQAGGIAKNEDTRMVNYTYSGPSCYTPKERKLAIIPDLQNLILYYIILYYIILYYIILYYIILYYIILYYIILYYIILLL